MKFTYLPLLAGCAVFAAQAAMAQGTIKSLYQFVQPSNSGANVTGTFEFDSTSPVPAGGFPLTAFSLSWLGGVNFGVVSTSDPRATFSSLPTFSGAALSGTLDVTMMTDFSTTRFLGNFGTTSASIDLIRLAGVSPPDHVEGAITYFTVPEPSTRICASLGLAGLFVWRQYRRIHA